MTGSFLFPKPVHAKAITVSDESKDMHHPVLCPKYRYPDILEVCVIHVAVELSLSLFR